MRNLYLLSFLAAIPTAWTLPSGNGGYLAPLELADGDEPIAGKYYVAFNKGHTLDQHFRVIGQDLRLRADLTFNWVDTIELYIVANLTNGDLLNRIRRDQGVERVRECQWLSIKTSPPESRGYQAANSSSGSHGFYSPIVPGYSSGVYASNTSDPDITPRDLKKWQVMPMEKAYWHLQAITAPGKVNGLKNQGGPAFQMSYAGSRVGGRGVNVYVVDSGVNINHPFFGGRAKNFGKAYACGDGDCYKDYIGHGTAVAGAVAGFAVGAAQGATIINVKLFWSLFDRKIIDEGDNILALKDILADHQRNLESPSSDFQGSVVNLSFGRHGTGPLRIEKLFDEMYYAGIIVVSSSGNDRQDGGTAANTWPCNMNTICVGGINKMYEQDWYSNTGSNVDILAPGSDITVLNYRFPHEEPQPLTSDWGTSFSAPLVAGVVAIYAGWERMRTGCVDDVNNARLRLEQNALQDVLTDNLAARDLGGSTNLLLNSGIMSPKKPYKDPYVGLGVEAVSVTYSDYNPFGIMEETGAISLYGMAATVTAQGETTTEAATSIAVTTDPAASDLSDDPFFDGTDIPTAATTTATATAPPPSTAPPATPTPKFAGGTCCFHLDEWENCNPESDDLYANVTMVDNDKHVIYQTPASLFANGGLGEPINNANGSTIQGPLPVPLAITGEHENDYVQFEHGNLQWTSRDTTGPATCSNGGWNPKDGPDCIPFDFNSFQPAENQMDCCFPC